MINDKAVVEKIYGAIQMDPIVFRISEHGGAGIPGPQKPLHSGALII